MLTTPLSLKILFLNKVGNFHTTSELGPLTTFTDRPLLGQDQELPTGEFLLGLHRG
jgi:hypothetical protein